ncbi:MAG: hypothetical protein J1F31_06600 [Erysipelotrichales bacterium]|nr:hypothetical protein [Erysipelotrichales bacterium]
MKVLIPFIYDIKLILYLIAVWNKQIPDLGYSRHWSIAKNCKLRLPLDNDNLINKRYVCQFITLIGDNYKNDLKNYLKTQSLFQNNLNKEEIKCLKDFKESKIKFIPIKIIDKFEVSNAHNILKSQIKSKSGKYPYVTATEGNNSVSDYIDYDLNSIEKGNVVFIGGKTLVISYQEKDFFSNDSHNLLIRNLSKEGLTENAQLFIVASLNKSLGKKYSWGDSISKAKIQEDVVSLPIKNDGEIDYDFMKNFINAIKKLIVKKIIPFIEISGNQQNPYETKNDYNSYLEAAEPFVIYQYSDFEASAKITESDPILIGCYKSPAHLQWILNQNKYNVRLGDRAGSMEEHKRLFNKTQKLVLYNVEEPTEIQVMEISDPKEITGKQINEMGYPYKRPEEFRYEIFNAIHSYDSGQQYSDLVKEVISKPDHIEGAPAFITPNNF